MTDYYCNFKIWFDCARACHLKLRIDQMFTVDRKQKIWAKHLNNEFNLYGTNLFYLSIGYVFCS